MPKTSTTSKKESDLTPHSSTAGVLVLQWLTYAFWGWLSAGLIWLIGVILTNAIVGESVSEIIPYAMAASIVLLPIAFVTDLFYRKHEPLRKAGAAMVIMIIHAVIFALFGIGALIVSVFTALNGLLNETNSGDVTLTVILVAASATILYAAAFLRTLNPFKKNIGSRIYAFAMLGLTLLLLIFAIVGPVISTITTRGDRDKDAALEDLTYAIQSYTYSEGALPADLAVLTVKESTDTLVKAGEIEYFPEGSDQRSQKDPNTTSYRYKLCVTYDYAAKNAAGSEYPWDTDEYKSYLDTTPHDAGRVCYKIRT